MLKRVGPRGSQDMGEHLFCGHVAQTIEKMHPLSLVYCFSFANMPKFYETVPLLARPEAFHGWLTDTYKVVHASRMDPS